MSKAIIEMPKDRIAEFCRRHHIRRLALFGSVLREDFRNDSDVDVLVEFCLSPYFRDAVLAEAEVQYDAA